MKTEALEESYKKIGALYPVLVDRKGKVIDGKHRKKVDPDWKEEIIDIEDEKDRLLIEFAANITRREITGKEIEQTLGKLAEVTGWNTRRIAIEVGRTEQWVGKKISQKYKDPKKVDAGKEGGEASAAKRCLAEEGEQSFITETDEVETESTTYIPDESDIGHDENGGEHLEFEGDIVTEDEEKVINKTEEDGIIDDKDKSYLLGYLDDEQFLTNVWISDGKRGEGEYIYGDPTFHGNTPPVIGFLSMMKHTEEGETILDPMAGSGTLIDICNGFNRKIKAYDIKPMRDDIQFGNATKIELPDESVDMIFCHFPYWNMVEYSTNENDISTMNFILFLSRVKEIFVEFKRVLKTKKYCAILIGDKRSGGVVDLSAHFSLIGSDYMNLHDKIIWVATKQKSMKGVQSNLSKYRAEKFGYHLQRFDTLLIFRKE